ncbi:Cthe_2314 family HEPN domain-containing protein [Empedobacter falsenii]|nr:hypothetical protein [Flavobacteriaceae bacterium]
MEDVKLINEINNKIIDIYNKQELIPLRGKDNSYIINNKQILSWHSEVTNPCFCKYEGHFNYMNNIEELLFISDEIVYFTAHLYFYNPYINDPIKDSYTFENKTIYPLFENLAGKRYDMYTNTCFEKVYNYWDRIGDLIASFYPNLFRKNIYFSDVMNKLEDLYFESENYKWLKVFLDTEFKSFNKQRINIVHKVTKNSEKRIEQSNNITDYEKSKILTEKYSSYPTYFKEMNEKCKIGFVKTLNLLEEINNKENYNCG